MSDIAVVIAETKGGLDAAIAGTGYMLIVGTARPFNSLTTCTDAPSANFGAIMKGTEGWIALAEQ